MTVRTLITGGAGYIGSHTAVALADAGHDVVIADNLSRAHLSTIDAIQQLAPSIEFHEGDVSDLNFLTALTAPDAIIHFAAFKSAPESIENPLAYYRNNVTSTLAVAQFAVETGVKRLVYSSSAAVYGNPTTTPVSEAAPTNPINPYGHTKLIGEQILQDITTATDLEVVILRYFNPVGAHSSGKIGDAIDGSNLVPRIMRTVHGSNEPVPVFGNDYDTSDGTAIRDYIHVLDLASGHLAALNTDLSDRCHTFNLGTGKGHSVLEVLHAAEQAIGAPIPHEMHPRRAGDPAAIWADPSAANQTFNWQATRTLSDMLTSHHAATD